MTTQPPSPSPGRRRRGGELRVALPGYRPPYKPNDLSHPTTRQVDEQLCAVLREQVAALPGKKPPRLVFEMRDSPPSEAGERQTRDAYHALFRDMAGRHSDALRRKAKRSGLLLCLGFATLLAAKLVSNSAGADELMSTIGEAVRVGGWVAMWTAVATVFAGLTDTVGSLLVFRRVAHAPIEFEYLQAERDADPARANSPHAPADATRPLAG
ncbi:hypothetical protein [Botrimarina sp.]|uniref:hypothetical protein n=1 Tax=Botrimarina sp. TaxID=2795802 RepID=UPI0032F00DCB